MTAIASKIRLQASSSMTYYGLVTTMLRLLALAAVLHVSANQGQQISWPVVMAAALLG
jgi:hypothetical protein